MGEGMTELNELRQDLKSAGREIEDILNRLQSRYGVEAIVDLTQHRRFGGPPQVFVSMSVEVTQE